MSSFKQALRQAVGVKTWLQFAKFLAYKSAITVLSYQSLKQLTAEFTPHAGVVWANSLVTQIVEFLVLGHRVFNGHKKSSALARRQFFRFWIVVAFLGLLEGVIMGDLLSTGWQFLPAYIVGHIPTALMRFYLDRYWVFRESLTPSSS